jgi:glycine/D-amino acid oxidase-like deaminating enzyme
MDTQYAIIGGGVVGISVAYGLQRLGCQTVVLDEGDTALRASRGNFGLVWVQSKGLDSPYYAQWSQQSAALWPGLADELEQQTGINIHLQQKGGFDFHFSEASLQQRVDQYTELKDKLAGNYPFEVLNAAQLKKEEPAIGPKVVGAILHHQDGHVNPLRLFNALHQAHHQLSGQLQNQGKVQSVTAVKGGYRIECSHGKSVLAEKVIICAGLGSNRFAEQLGFTSRVLPIRGQNIVTERIPTFMHRPSMTIRQVNEGSVQLGDSKEDVSFDDGTTMDITAKIANRAVSTYPCLGKVRMLRSWGALRIMSPDGLPIYAQSSKNPGCYWMTCHSGITLAAVHSQLLPLWLEGNENAPNLEKFDEKRFHI